MSPPPTKQAFSLVELSIVLVILGLLVGGVLSGQSLIRAAELRAVNTEFTRYQAAINSFRDKYFALPGDMTNAYDFWGVAMGCTNTTTYASNAGCNGNGDGQIAYNNSEMYRVWQELARAGLIEGSYSGDYAAATAIIGTNVPASKLSNGGYGIGYVTPSLFEVWESTIAANYLQIGSVFAANNPIAAILKPEDAWNIDTKMDDGKPATGKLVGGNALGAAGGCTTGSGASTTYTLTGTSVQCGIALNIN